MAVLSTVLETVTPISVLKALKNFLGSSWTLDETNLILWSPAPSGLPIGFGVYETSNVKYITLVSKANGVNTKIDVPTRGRLPSSAAAVTAYVSPGGSVGICISNSTGINKPGIFILKNTNTNSSVASYFGLAFNENNTAVNLIAPGNLDVKASYVGFNQTTIHSANAYTLTQAADPYTGTALKDLYMLLSKCDTGSSASAPDILANGSAKYVKNAATESIYLRYE